MLVALDTETHLITNEAPVPRLVCTSLATVDGDSDLIHRNDPAHKRTVEALLNEEEIVIFNAPFDLTVYCEEWDEFIPLVFRTLDEGRIFDPSVRDKLLHIADGTFKTVSRSGDHPFTLQEIVRRSLSVVLDKSNDTYRTRYGSLEDTPLSQWPEEAKQYALDDSSILLHLMGHQELAASTYLRDDEVEVFADQHRQNQSALALHLSGVHGVMVDQDAVKALDASIAAKWERVKEELTKAYFVRTDGTKNTKLVKAYVEKICNERGITPKLTKTNDISLDADAREIYQDDLLDLYGDYTDLMKLRGTYITSLERAGNAPVRPYWNVLGADTGRISCKNPNLTQLPRAPGVRECYVPRPGCVFVSCDYDKSEVVSWGEILYQMFGSSKIGDAVNAGLDVHLMFAAEYLSITYDEAKARYIAGDKDVADARQAGKPANFGFQGGMGPDRHYATQRKDMERDKFLIAFPHGVESAREHRHIWKRTWAPEAEQYLAYIGDLTREGTTSIISHKSGRLRGGLTYTETANAFFQQLTADYAKQAHYRVTKRQFLNADSALYGSHIIALVHDEIIIEIEKSKAQAGGQELAEVMVSTANEWCTYVKSSATPKTMDRWRKL